MKYKLKPLDQLIHNKQFISEEVEQIINKLSQTAYSLRSDEEMILFLRNHQIALLDHKHNDAIRQQSDHVLFFLESNFGSYLNESLSNSDIGKHKLFVKWLTIVSETKEALDTTLSIKLLNTIQPLFQLNSNKSYSIHKTRFIINFWKNWQEDFKLMHDTYTEENVTNFLIANNFNTPVFFRYIIGDITKELQKEDHPEIQQIVLESYSKRFRLIAARVDKPYRKDFPSIHKLINNWLATELKQCRKKLKTYNPQQQVLGKDPAHTRKIKTSLSVAQLVYVFRLLNQTGIVTNNTQTEILQAIINCYSTQKVNDIAFESLHNKYYNIEDRTRETIKEMLEKMIKAIEW